MRLSSQTRFFLSVAGGVLLSSGGGLGRSGDHQLGHLALGHARRHDRLRARHAAWPRRLRQLLRAIRRLRRRSGLAAGIDLYRRPLYAPWSAMRRPADPASTTTAS